MICPSCEEPNHEGRTHCRKCYSLLPAPSPDTAAFVFGEQRRIAAEAAGVEASRDATVRDSERDREEKEKARRREVLIAEARAKTEASAARLAAMFGAGPRSQSGRDPGGSRGR